MAVLRGVLTQRGQADAVLECDAAEGEGGEDLGEDGAVGLRVGCGAGFRVLVGREVADAGLGDVAHALKLRVEGHREWFPRRTVR